MVWASSYGKIILSMRGSGRMERLMARVGLFTPLERSMRGIGKMISLMDMEFITTLMVPAFPENGGMINSTGME